MLTVTWFKVFQINVNNFEIDQLDETLAGTANSGQNQPGSNGNESVELKKSFT